MLLGEHKRAVSAAGQLVIPQQILAELDGSLVIARGFEQNLILFPKEDWQLLATGLLNRPISNQDVRALRRRLFSGAAEVTPDANGRVTLPVELRSFAGINGEVVLAGMYDHLELWSADRWLSVRESDEANDDGDRWTGIGI